MAACQPRRLFEPERRHACAYMSALRPVRVALHLAVSLLQPISKESSAECNIASRLKCIASTNIGLYSSLNFQEALHEERQPAKFHGAVFGVGPATRGCDREALLWRTPEHGRGDPAPRRTA